jgi:hypothetical protein
LLLSGTGNGGEERRFVLVVDGNLDFAVDVEGAWVAAGDAGHQAVVVAGFGAGENIGVASMPLPLPWRVTAKLYEIPAT